MSEEGLPKATVNKVIRDSVPNDLKVASEVRDIVAEAAFGTWNLICILEGSKPPQRCYLMNSSLTCISCRIFATGCFGGERSMLEGEQINHFA